MAADIPVFLYSLSADRHTEDKFFCQDFFLFEKKNTFAAVFSNKSLFMTLLGA
ncbi:hypothetical protein [Porphyromonas gingivalis]|uniref:hypothetical protein n=1 Tax=Porphyromonas gingivalis TaxID=837 RepID=UPI00040BFA9B|nr:hypothetical protein [Porphyromonas gingivalis]OWR80685.1 hypothetical protein SJDPG11_10135 [Porphyromonas gingivalis SJD11]